MTEIPNLSFRPLNFTPIQQEIAKLIEIIASATTYIFYDPTKQEDLAQSIGEFAQYTCQDNASNVAILILQVISTMNEANDLLMGPRFLIVTANKPSSVAVGPTWHIDQKIEMRIDPSYRSDHTKYINAAVLKGTGTAFSAISTDDLSAEEVDCLVFEELDQCDGLAEKISQYPNIFAPAEHIARFAMGSEVGIIHSAPSQSTDRIFIGSVLLDCENMNNTWCKHEAWHGIVGMIRPLKQHVEILPTGEIDS